MLFLLFAALIGVSISFTGFAFVAAEATPEASPVAKSKMPAYFAGNAYDLVPQGQSGKLDVVLVGPLFGNAMPIVIRNNTKQPLDDVQATVEARDASGALLASGKSVTVYPHYLIPGAVSLTYVYFQQPQNLTGATFIVTATGKSPDSDSSSDYMVLNIAEVDLQTDHLVGMAHNDYSESVEIPSVYGECFNEEGAIIGYFEGFISSDIGPNDDAPFDVPLYGPDTCNLFLVVAAGHSSKF